jgi:glucose dehydrogenase
LQLPVRIGAGRGPRFKLNRGLEATPIVVDGLMYTSGITGKAYALDAKTGKELWSFDPKSTVAPYSPHGKSRTSHSLQSCASRNFRPHPEQISFRCSRLRLTHKPSVLAASSISCR